MIQKAFGQAVLDDDFSSFYDDVIQIVLDKSFIVKAEFSAPAYPNMDRETTRYLIFPTTSPKQAALDALRWWKNRQEALDGLGEYPTFGILWCLKIHRFELMPIEANGYQMMPSGPQIFEWKYDWGTTIEAHIEGRL